MNKNENLDVDKSPDWLKKPSIVSGVKTLNKKPIAIISFVVLLLIIGLGYAAAQRGDSNNKPTDQTDQQKEKSAQDGKVQLNSMVDDLQHNAKKGGQVQGSQAQNNLDPLGQYSTQPTGQTAQGNVNDPMTPKAPPRLNTNGAGGYNSAENNRQQMLEEKRKLLAGAVNSPTKIKIEGNNDRDNSSGLNGSNMAKAPNPYAMLSNTAAAGNQAANDATKGFLNRLGGGNGIEPPPTNNDERNEPWMSKADKSYDYLTTSKAKPISPYEVKAGTVIPGVMITGVNSDLPGQILGVVSENVYDTGTGRHLLIPQGSKLVGIYSANVIFGQERVMVAWNRVIFPDAKTLNLGAMPGTDQAGYAGFSDQVNNHYMKIFGSAFMMSMITGGIAVSSNNNGNQFTQTPSDQMIAAMIQQMGEVGKQLIQKNLRIAPTLEIRPGYKFNIFVTKDMILEPLSY